MIYITFDTNIWIYTLSDSWKVDNELDYLEYWIESGQTKILLPEIIRDEWDKHKEDRANERRNDLSRFFDMAEEVLPMEFFKEYSTPNARNKIIDQQLERINKVIGTAEWIPLCDKIKEEVLKCGIKKEAPMHKKNSIADAIIIFSLFDFIKKNPGNEYFFVSNNTADFYQKKSSNKTEIHSDLKPRFEKLNIRDYKSFNHMRVELEKVFNLTFDHDFRAKRKQASRIEMKKQIYNPHYERLAKGTSALFSQNKKMLDFILKEDIPTKEQVIFVLSLIDSDNDYEKYFYGKVHGKAWFNILLSKDIFNPKNNPIIFGQWLPLIFLQNLAKEEKDSEILSKIIDIITDVSEKSHDNPSTWWQLVMILKSMPSQYIPIEIFKYIPKWVKGDGRFSTTANQICTELIPKLYKENSNENKDKIVTIVKHFFELTDKEKTEKSSYSFGSSYLTFIDGLTDYFDERLISIIVSSCPKEIISHLIEQLKRIYYTFPNGMSFLVKKGSADIQINLSVDFNQKSIEVLPDNGETIIISNFDKKSELQLRKELTNSLLKQGFALKQLENEDMIDYSLQSITTGLSFVFGSYGVEEYKSQHSNDNPEFAFVSILLEIINKYVQENLNEGLHLLSEIIENEEYRLAVLRQISIFVIGNNWEKTKDLFLEKLQNGQIDKFFLSSIFQTDFYRFLKKKQSEFDSDTLKLFDKIIKKAIPYKRYGNQGNLQLRWYSALKDTNRFKNRYEKLSNKLGYDSKHFDTEGRMLTASGEISPLTVNDLMGKSNSEIVDYINKFKPTRDFAAPSISGLGRTLENAVKLNPERFSENINDFISLPYIYIYYIIYGFYYAWQEKKTFDWEKILDFCLQYINNEKFYTNELQTEDHLGANADWVVGVISNLLQEGMKSDEHSMPISLLPKVKKILIIFSKHLKPEASKKQTNDYLSYTLNSTAGKVLRGLIVYSLCNARNNLKTASVKWKKEIVIIFEKSLETKIIDSYILIGMYYRQFLYLSKSWTKNKSIAFQSLDENLWKAFWRGYLYSGFIPSKQDYSKYIPHYEKAILTSNTYSDSYGNGFIHHITSFYFREYEDISDNGLVKKFCQTADAGKINEFINYISHQDGYINLLKSEEERKIFQDRIIDLWAFLIKRFEKPKEDKEQEIISRLCGMASLVQELNKKVTDLILISCPNIEKFHGTRSLLENLVRLSKSGIPKITAEYVGRIISSVPINSFSFYRNEEVKDIMVFLFENEQCKVALKFCDNRLRIGDESFNDLIEKYKGRC